MGKQQCSCCTFKNPKTICNVSRNCSWHVAGESDARRQWRQRTWHPVASHTELLGIQSGANHRRTAISLLAPTAPPEWIWTERFKLAVYVCVRVLEMRTRRRAAPATVSLWFYLFFFFCVAVCVYQTHCVMCMRPVHPPVCVWEKCFSLLHIVSQVRLSIMNSSSVKRPLLRGSIGKLSSVLQGEDWMPVMEGERWEQTDI